MNTTTSSETSDIRDTTHEIFDLAMWRADFGRLKAIVTGKRRMPTLASRLEGKVVRGQHSLGLHTVELKRIFGTESRIDDFDANFNPLHDRMRGRWESIAEVSLLERGLPAVELIQVGEEYFVRDGHHRISVARALGWGFIDAQVTVMEV